MKTYLTKKQIEIKFTILLVICTFVIAISACTNKQSNTNEDASVTNSSKKQDTNSDSSSNTASSLNTSTLNTYYTIVDDNEDTLCAVYFLGYFEEEVKENATQLFNTNNINLSFDSIDDLERADADGNEWYLILPKYLNTQVVVSKAELNNNGELKPTEDILTTTKPLLLKCNPSDIVPSSQVTVTYNNDSITFNPSISLKDGDITPFDRVYTKSMLFAGPDMDSWNTLLTDIYNAAPGTAGSSLKSARAAGELLDWLEDYAPMTDMDTLKEATKTWMTDNKDIITSMEDLAASWNSVANNAKTILTDRDGILSLLEDAGYTLQHDTYTETNFNNIKSIFDELFLT
ncbi:hypothetical protein [Anaerosporobacter sp.]